MKSRFVPALLALAITASAADGPELSGRWKVVFTINDYESSLDCTFNRKEKALTGSCQGGNETFPITGEADGRKVTWQFTTKYENQPLTLVYTGTLDAGQMAGMVEVRSRGAQGRFTATPITEAPTAKQ